VIDLDAPQFRERGGMVAKLTGACRDSGAPAPATRGEISRLVFENLADGYRRTIDELETLTGTRARVVHIVGGGARNRLLNQLTADACGRRVVAGPEEATVLGNLLVQARALGDLPRGVAIRDVARASVALSEFLPVPVPTR
jgi:rhamnulokinase